MIRLHMDDDLRPTWQSRIQGWLERAFAAHAHSARRLIVNLRRESGPLVGAAIFACEISGRLPDGSRLAVHCESADAAVAVTQACARARRALVRACLQPRIGSARTPLSRRSQTRSRERSR